MVAEQCGRRVEANTAVVMQPPAWSRSQPGLTSSDSGAMRAQRIIHLFNLQLPLRNACDRAAPCGSALTFPRLCSVLAHAFGEIADPRMMTNQVVRFGLAAILPPRASKANALASGSNNSKRRQMIHNCPCVSPVLLHAFFVKAKSI